MASLQLLTPVFMTTRVPPTQEETEKALFLRRVLLIDTPMSLTKALASITEAAAMYPTDLSRDFNNILTYYLNGDIFSIMKAEEPVLFVISSGDLLTPMTGKRGITTGFSFKNSNGMIMYIFLYISCHELNPNKVNSHNG